MIRPCRLGSTYLGAEPLLPVTLLAVEPLLLVEHGTTPLLKTSQLRINLTRSSSRSSFGRTGRGGGGPRDFDDELTADTSLEQPPPPNVEDLAEWGPLKRREALVRRPKREAAARRQSTSTYWKGGGKGPLPVSCPSGSGHRTGQKEAFRE